MQPAVFTSFKEEGTFTLTQRKFDLNEKCIWLAVPPTIIFKKHLPLAAHPPDRPCSDPKLCEWSPNWCHRDSLYTRRTQ